MSIDFSSHAGYDSPTVKEEVSSGLTKVFKYLSRYDNKTLNNIQKNLFFLNLLDRVSKLDSNNGVIVAFKLKNIPQPNQDCTALLELIIEMIGEGYNKGSVIFSELIDQILDIGIEDQEIKNLINEYKNFELYKSNERNLEEIIGRIRTRLYREQEEATKRLSSNSES